MGRCAEMATRHDGVLWARPKEGGTAGCIGCEPNRMQRGAGLDDSMREAAQDVWGQPETVNKGWGDGTQYGTRPARGQ